MHPATAATILTAHGKAKARLNRARSAFELNYDLMGYEERAEQGHIVDWQRKVALRMLTLVVLTALAKL